MSVSDLGSHTSSTSMEDEPPRGRKGSLSKILGSPFTKRKKPKKVFGMALNQLDLHPTLYIPMIAFRMLDFLGHHGMSFEGLFRISGSQKIIEQLKQKIDKGHDVDFEKEGDIQAVTSLFKMFLRELPDPLVPVLLQKEIEALKITSAQVNLSKTPRIFIDVRDILLRLPALNMKLLDYLVFFLTKVDAAKAFTKMSAENLAIIMTPNLFGSNSDDLKSFGIKTNLNVFVALLIVHYKSIFHPAFLPPSSLGVAPKEEETLSASDRSTTSSEPSTRPHQTLLSSSPAPEETQPSLKLPQTPIPAPRSLPNRPEDSKSQTSLSVDDKLTTPSHSAPPPLVVDVRPADTASLLSPSLSHPTTPQVSRPARLQRPAPLESHDAVKLPDSQTNKHVSHDHDTASSRSVGTPLKVLSLPEIPVTPLLNERGYVMDVSPRTSYIEQQLDLPETPSLNRELVGSPVPHLRGVRAAIRAVIQSMIWGGPRITEPMDARGTFPPLDLSSMAPNLHATKDRPRVHHKHPPSSHNQTSLSLGGSLFDASSTDSVLPHGPTLNTSQPNPHRRTDPPKVSITMMGPSSLQRHGDGNNEHGDLGKSSSLGASLNVSTESSVDALSSSSYSMLSVSSVSSPCLPHASTDRTTLELEIRKLAKTIKKFENDFIEEHKRKPVKNEKRPIIKELKEYRRLKLLLEGTSHELLEGDDNHEIDKTMTQLSPRKDESTSLPLPSTHILGSPSSQKINDSVLDQTIPVISSENSPSSVVKPRGKRKLPDVDNIHLSNGNSVQTVLVPPIVSGSGEGFATEGEDLLLNPLEFMTNRFNQWRETKGISSDYQNLSNSEIAATKSFLKHLLAEFDSKFEKKHGRSVQREDKLVLRPLYNIYKSLKTKLDTSSAPIVSPSKGVVCSCCQTVLSLNSKFCNNCGAKVTSLDVSTLNSTFDTAGPHASPRSESSSKPRMLPQLGVSQGHAWRSSPEESTHKHLPDKTHVLTAAPISPSNAIISPELTPENSPAGKPHNTPSATDPPHKLLPQPSVGHGSPKTKQTGPSPPADHPSSAQHEGGRHSSKLGLHEPPEIEKLRVEKKRLQKMLHKFEEKFSSEHGRPVQTNDDRAPQMANYTRYRDLKKLLEHLENS